MQNLEYKNDTAIKTLPTVSIVVPCRNERGHIEVAIKSIMAQEAPPGGLEVIVADGMSVDGTRAILKRYERENACIRVVDNPSRIVSTALNVGIREARGFIIIRMDAHTSYAPDYVRQCVQALEETGADNVGGPWIARGRGRIGRAIAAAFQSPFGCGGARGHDRSYSGPVDTVYLGCWRREIFDRIGFFDEELVRNQDDEFNLRIVRSGGKVYQSVKIRSWYYPRENLYQLFVQYAQYGYWKACILRKHRLPASLRHIIPAGFIFMMVVLPILSFFWPIVLVAWFFLLGLYISVNILLSVLTAAYNGWQVFLLLPLVFAVFHFAYGLGFLKGFADFILLRRKSSRIFTALTRSSREELPREA
jgi:glycosyltransferase involved in cell wall biosynthesis